MEHPPIDSLMRFMKTIMSPVHEEQMLQLILQTAMDSIPTAEAGFLFLHDPLINKLIIQATVGYLPAVMTMTRLSSGEGLSGKVFAERTPIRINNPLALQSAMDNMSAFNYKYYVESSTQGEIPCCCISVPLLSEDRCIGVVTLDNFTDDQALTEHDLQSLQIYCDLATMAIEHHRLFRQVQEQNHELFLTHDALRQEHERLQVTMDFHNQINNLAAKGFGTPEILSALYRNVKMPIAVFDLLLTPIDYLPAEVKPHLPDQFLQHPAMQWVQRSKKWQRIVLEEDASQSIIVTPIVGTDRLLGYLCAWTGSQEFMSTNKMIFEYSATVLALDWVKKEAVQQSQMRAKDAFFESILSGEMNTSLQEQARVLGFEQEDHYAVMLMQPLPVSARHTFESIMSQLHIHYLLVERHHHTIIIVNIAGNLNKEERQSQFQLLLRELRRDRQLSSGIGRIYQGLDKVSRSYKDAEQCMQLLLKEGNQQRLIYFGDLGVIRFFMQQSREELEEYLNDVLEPIIQYDRQKKASLMITLVSFVKYDRNLKNTTQSLRIHHNTLYYRLGRIQELLGYSFDHGDEWFNVRMACQIYLYLYED